MRRGEIWTAAARGEGYTGKPRPVVIVQADQFSGTKSITVCPLTSNPLEAPLTRPNVEPDGRNGLQCPSRFMVDKLTSMPRSKLGRKVGVLSHGHLAEMDLALRLFLGLAP